MTIDHMNVNTCANVGHHIASLSLVRCQHRESYTLTAWYMIDGGEGLQHVVRNKTVEFGPFDTRGEIITTVREALEMLMVHAMAYKSDDEDSRVL